MKQPFGRCRVRHGDQHSVLWRFTGLEGLTQVAAEGRSAVVEQGKDGQNASTEEERASLGKGDDEDTGGRSQVGRQRERGSLEGAFQVGMQFVQAQHGQIGAEEHEQVACTGDIAQEVHHADGGDQRTDRADDQDGDVGGAEAGQPGEHVRPDAVTAQCEGLARRAQHAGVDAGQGGDDAGNAHQGDAPAGHEAADHVGQRGGGAGQFRPGDGS